MELQQDDYTLDFSLVIKMTTNEVKKKLQNSKERE
jgi:hypothetical protein